MVMPADWSEATIGVSRAVIDALVRRGAIDGPQLQRDLRARANLWRQPSRTREALSGEAVMTTAFLDFVAADISATATEEPTSKGRHMTDEQVDAGRKPAREILLATLEALSETDREQSGLQIAIGFYETWGVTIAALIGRELLEGPNLRLNLLGEARLRNGKGDVGAGALIEAVANRIDTFVAAVETRKKYPLPSGRA